MLKKEDVKPIYSFQTLDYRKYFKNTKTFSFDHHQKYIDKFMKIDGNLFFTIKKNKKKVIGFIKLENKNKKFYISITIHKKYQSLGLGTKILKYFLSKTIIKEKIYAEIKKNNLKSIKAFTRAGFELNKNIKLF